jgi:hypothetical protein
MASDAIADHYQVLEELGRKFFFSRAIKKKVLDLDANVKSPW